MTRKIRVGVDARRFNFDGIGRITGLVIEALEDLCDFVEPVVLTAGNRGLLPETKKSLTVPFDFGVISSVAFDVMPTVVREHKIDVMIGPQWYSIIKLPCASIGFLHDAAPFDASAPIPSLGDFVDAFSGLAVDRLIEEVSDFIDSDGLSGERGGIALYQAMYRAMLHRCQTVLTVSQASRAAIARSIPDARHKLVVCPPYVAASLSNATPVARSSLPQRFFLNIGKWEPRKRQIDLLNAIELAHRVDLTIHLVIIGDQFELYRDYAELVKMKVLALQTVGAVTWLPAASDDVLATAYANAIATVISSEYEGFCIPIIEAMHFGTAVAATYGGAIEEVCGGACLPLEKNTESVRQLLLDLWQNPKLARQYRSAARLRVPFYSKERFTSTLLEVIREAV